MTQIESQTQEVVDGTQGHVYRVDKFIVPAEGRDEFVRNVQMTHDLLRTLPGFVQDFVLEQASGPGAFNFVTLVAWESEAAIEQAREAVQALHTEQNFNPQELFARLGIRADLGTYHSVDEGAGAGYLRRSDLS